MEDSTGDDRASREATGILPAQEVITTEVAVAVAVEAGKRLLLLIQPDPAQLCTYVVFFFVTCKNVKCSEKLVTKK